MSSCQGVTLCLAELRQHAGRRSVSYIRQPHARVRTSGVGMPKDGSGRRCPARRASGSRRPPHPHWRGDPWTEQPTRYVGIAAAPHSPHTPRRRLATGDWPGLGCPESRATILTHSEQPGPDLERLTCRNRLDVLPSDHKRTYPPITAITVRNGQTAATGVRTRQTPRTGTPTRLSPHPARHLPASKNRTDEMGRTRKDYDLGTGGLPSHQVMRCIVISRPTGYPGGTGPCGHCATTPFGLSHRPPEPQA